MDETCPTRPYSESAFELTDQLAPEARSPVLQTSAGRWLDTEGVTQYSFEDDVKTTTMNGNKVYTFTFKVSDPIDTDNSCAYTDLFKAEFWTSRACQKRTVVNAYINGIKVTPMWDARTGVWRVAQLNMNNITAAGATVGLELDATSNCPTLRSLCNRMGGKCVYSLFNKKRDCCPVGENLYSLTSGYDR
eukprot:gene15596-21700_t